MNRVMVDIETLGQSNEASVISIGAVKFTEDGVTDDTFYENVDLESATDLGLEIEPGTLLWWLKQDDEVQDVLTGGRPLTDVLEEFIEWYGDADEVWANSPSFDCEILESAMDAAGVEYPWTYKEKRDFRTVYNLPHNVDADDPDVDGNEHNALDDARWQAAYTALVLDGMLSKMFGATTTKEEDRTI